MGSIDKSQKNNNIFKAEYDIRKAKDIKYIKRYVSSGGNRSIYRVQ